MNTANNIVFIANSKLIESEFLLGHGYGDTAYYLAGYAVELYIKARICKTLDIDNFYDFGNRTKIINEDNITKPYKVHNFEQLLVLSGVYNKFIKQRENLDFWDNWIRIIDWKEDSRYTIGRNKEKVNEFINCVKTFAIWIEQFL